MKVKTLYDWVCVLAAFDVTLALPIAVWRQTHEQFDRSLFYWGNIGIAGVAYVLAEFAARKGLDE